jgi:hypothetical protein
MTSIKSGGRGAVLGTCRRDGGGRRAVGHCPAGAAGNTPPAATLDQSAVLLATVDTLPWPYEVLGLVEAAMSAAAGIVPTARLMARLQDHALDWAADAVIGIRLNQLVLPGASRLLRVGWFGRIEHRENLVVAIATGTAVRRGQRRR